MEQREKGKSQLWIYNLCPVCRGTGKVVTDEDRTVSKYVPWYPGDEGDYIDCPCCQLGDNNRFPILRLRYQRDVFAAWEIFECIDNDEYNSLNDTQRNAVDLIMSLGRVNIGNNTKARTLLSAFFPTGSITRNKIADLLENQAET